MKYKGKRMSFERYRQLQKAKKRRTAAIPKTPVSRALYELLKEEYQ
jgi:hypothetical protein